MKVKITEIDFSKFRGGEMKLRIKDAGDQEWFRGRIRKLAVPIQTKSDKSDPPDNKSGSAMKVKIDLAWLAKEYTVTKISSVGAVNVSRYELIAKPYRKEPGETTLFSKILTHFMFFRYDMELDIIDSNVEARADGVIQLETTLGELCILLPSGHPEILNEELLKNT